ncbi:RNAse P Rpr2/Rpp21 subunit [Penicillium cf. griseofulvum]|uniref:RNAse P Rpr2/Rpp21 subunit n=1 Tax=Penicillium cf. griseofulvum TaxID=2972120 RepID=A0A9W9JGE0_9EURO|nr:RNAse P Rpr2/Rpp21 subunit [Penicillium cf. griseofulvum]KAJ5445716.1 RNAse P Rpr2/Rpp21 subunit [Penicillium cf. griseofulvum]KAJ5447438.1 RNAse P Rpr2/Rpp21 subunit [Penicillium cf. griseofulvum]
MAKVKGKKEPKNSKNSQSHIRARLDYLHQAAAYFQGKSTLAKGQNAKVVNNEYNLFASHVSSGEESHTVDTKEEVCSVNQKNTQEPLRNLSRVCVSHLRAVAMKTQIRLPVTLKRSICKRCDTILTPGVTCSHETRNASRGGKKSWADVLVVKCLSCRTEKRFPQTEKRGKKLAERRKEKDSALLRDVNAPKMDTSAASQEKAFKSRGEDVAMLDAADVPTT